MSESSVYHCSLIYRQPVYLPFYSFVPFNCLPVYRRPVSLCLLTTADLSTVYLSFYSFVSANFLPVFLFLCICQLPTTCQPTCMSTDYSRPVYRLPVFLYLCIYLLPTCLPLTCPPMATDYCRPVQHLPISLHLPPAYRRPAYLCPLTTADLSTRAAYRFTAFIKNRYLRFNR